MTVPPSLSGATPEWYAAGTDLTERRRSGVSTGPIRHIVPTPEMTAFAVAANGGAVIGASVTIAALAAERHIAAHYPGITAAAGGLATPQIRNMATVGGNLTQRSRCWYFRNPHVACLKKGGNDCPARTGNHRYGVAFDLGPCVAPHPSTLAAAFLAYDAKVETSADDTGGRAAMTIEQLLGDGRDGRRDHQLAPGALIRTIHLPAPLEGERAVYRRAISRNAAEWPLVEIVARIVPIGGRAGTVRVVVGGVAPVPLRLHDVETALTGAVLDGASFGAAASLATRAAKPLAETGYKLVLLDGLMRDALERLAAP